MKQIIFSLIFIFLCANIDAQERKHTATDGFPLANFSTTVNYSQSGDFFGLIMKNPGKLGPWLEEEGSLLFSVEKNGKKHAFSQFGTKEIVRQFPGAGGSYSNSDLIAASISTTAFCPLGINDLETSSLPVILLQLDCQSPKNEKFNIVITPDAASKKSIDAKNLTIVNSDLSTKNDDFIIPVELNAGESKTIRIAIEVYDDEQVYTKWFKRGEAGKYALQKWSFLREKTKQFADALPQINSEKDSELKEYLNWYIVPAIALTRCTKNGEVLTMGYCELNQRDSYWTSWLHLVLYKDLERKMLEESVQYQQPSGKIPTTILPLIERHDDLDINAFFILREARYYRLYHETNNLATDWDAMKKAMDWLISRDKSGNGLPEQVSFWGDWKDVQGVTERRYSPFSGLIYLAALKEMVYLSKELEDKESAAKYLAAYKKGFDFINQPTNKGGLWNGNFYCQIWKDGSVNEHLLQDQTIGILFGVVPKDRAEKIIESLNKQSLTDYGIAETTPYYTQKEFHYKPATYHNGAVWPWMSFMDCWSRLKLGGKDKESEVNDLIKRVAKADLVDSGDYSPNEHINSKTGENLGFILQGWNAGLYGLVYFGFMHPELEITGDNDCNLKP
jgi:uncharacterized protein (DUF608 family)